MTLRCCALETELDQILIAEREDVVVAVHFGRDRGAFAARLAEPDEQSTWSAGLDSPAREQLRQYLAGQRQAFDLRLRPRGTPFQQEVWAALQTIPFGTTCSYSDIAARIGRPSAVRAVGAANGKNPIAIIVPCHRVIGRNGTLTGYAGGLDRKRRLLELEGSLGVSAPRPVAGSA